MLKGTGQLQIPSPFTDRLVEPPLPPVIDKSKTKLVKRNTLKEMVMNKAKVLSKNDMADLSELEIKKYNTRMLLNDILDSKTVKRQTASPWEVISNGSVVKPFLKQKEVVV